jgi:hypothetical protein
MARQVLAALLALLVTFPAWGESNVVGNIVSSQSATVRGTSLTPGSTIFAGDSIHVGPQGSAWITLAGGGQVRVGENSLVSLDKMPEKIQMTVHRGIASFRTAEKSPVEALLGDATVRSADGLPAVGVISVRDPQSAFIAAEKGTLLITTEHDSNSVTLREGDGAEVTLVLQQDTDQEKEKKKKKGGAATAGSAPSGGSLTAGKAAIIGAIVAGVAVGIAIGLLNQEPSNTVNNNCNAVSPFRCP